MDSLSIILFFYCEGGYGCVCALRYSVLPFYGRTISTASNCIQLSSVSSVRPSSRPSAQSSSQCSPPQTHPLSKWGKYRFGTSPSRNIFKFASIQFTRAHNEGMVAGGLQVWVDDGRTENGNSLFTFLLNSGNLFQLNKYTNGMWKGFRFGWARGAPVNSLFALLH